MVITAQSQFSVYNTCSLMVMVGNTIAMLVYWRVIFGGEKLQLLGKVLGPSCYLGTITFSESDQPRGFVLGCRTVIFIADVHLKHNMQVVVITCNSMVLGKL